MGKKYGGWRLPLETGRGMSVCVSRGGAGRQKADRLNHEWEDNGGIGLAEGKGDWEETEEKKKIRVTRKEKVKKFIMGGI